MLVEMLGGIWISDKKILNNTGFIQDKNISGIVNCIKDLKVTPLKTGGGKYSEECKLQNKI